MIDPAPGMCSATGCRKPIDHAGPCGEPGPHPLYRVEFSDGTERTVDMGGAFRADDWTLGRDPATIERITRLDGRPRPRVRIRRGFGGGWRWKVGAQGSENLLVVSLFRFEVRIERRRRA